MATNTQSEDQLLADCIQWAWNYVPETRRLIWHVANERATSPVHGAQLKAKGVVPGACDVVFFWDGRVYIFEFKTITGTISQDQRRVIAALEKQKHLVKIIRDKETWMNEIRHIVKRPKI